jgi:uncharacterized membrane-anchored protein
MRTIAVMAFALFACAAAAPVAAQEQTDQAPAQEQTAPTALEAVEENAATGVVDQEAGPQITEQELAQAQAFYESLNRRTGPVTLLDGKVVMTVPETHYFLGAEDARRVIVDVWRNPPGAAQGVLGMVFLADANPWFSWGAVVEYSDDGHVNDNDAATINYDDLLRDLQRSMNEANPERVRQGYPEMTLDAWAERPHYEQASHTLYWAKLLSTSDGASALNYDVRVLGREGVFVMSFVAAPEDLELIRSSAPAVMAMPAFTEGNRYADYREGVDRAAAYGIGGLIAGGALAAVAQKTGLIALLLAVGKKFIVLIIAGFAALGGAIMRMFRRSDPS